MTSADPLRNREIAAIKMGQKKLGLDDDSYRDLLEQLTGKRSAARLDDTERRNVIEHFRRLGFSRSASSAAGGRSRRADKSTGAPASAKARPMVAQHYKAREIWRALYLLGAVDHGDDRTLDAFCKRTAKVDALKWTTPAQANKVIEALKAIAARHGYAVPDAKGVDEIDGWRATAGQKKGGYALAAHVRLIQALWEKLIVAGALRTGAHARLDTWLAHQGYGVSAPWFLTLDQARDAAERLGLWLKHAKNERDPAAPD